MTSQDTAIPVAIAAHPSPAMVRVVEHRHTSSTLDDLVSVRFGDPNVHVDLLGSLHVMQLVVAEVARQLVEIEEARR